MILREDLANRLNYLCADAKYSFWPVGSDKSDDTKGYEDTIIIDGWRIAWDAGNPVPCPTLEQINAVDVKLLAASMGAQRKLVRNAQYKTDMAVLAGYNTAKTANPDLIFSDYLDQLEALSV